MNEPQVQEGKNGRQQEVRYTNDESDDATITEQFVGIKMDQYETFPLSRKIHFTNSYTEEFSNKSYDPGTLNMNLYEPFTIAMSKEETMMNVLGVDMIQTLSLKNFLKKFGTRGEKAVTKKLTKLNDMQTYLILEPNNFTKDQQSKSLGSLLFLLEKHNGDIKSRGCDDVIEQHRR